MLRKNIPGVCHGVSAELVLYPEEKHGKGRAAARLDASLRQLRWIEHYVLGPGGEPPPWEIDYHLDDQPTDEAALP